MTSTCLSTTWPDNSFAANRWGKDSARCNGHFSRIHTNYVRDYAKSEFETQTQTEKETETETKSVLFPRVEAICTFAIISQCTRSSSNRQPVDQIGILGWHVACGRYLLKLKCSLIWLWKQGILSMGHNSNCFGCLNSSKGVKINIYAERKQTTTTKKPTKTD